MRLDREALLSMKNLLKLLIKKFYKITEISDSQLINSFEGSNNYINLLDIGAAKDIEPRWSGIAKNLNYLGVEPDSRSKSALSNKRKCYKYETFDKIIWEEEKNIKFFITKKPTCSSILEPNREFLDKFPNPSRHDIVETKIVKTSTISKEFSGNQIDFIKIDIQGAELNALKGIKEVIENCLGFELEIQFAKLYKNAANFSELNNFLIEKEFVFIDFVNLCRWERNEYNSYGQMAFGDGLWLRSPEYISSRLPNKVPQYITICSLYGRYDLIYKVIELSSIGLSAESMKILKKLVRRQSLSRSLHSKLSSLIRLVAGKETTKSHLIY